MYRIANWNIERPKSGTKKTRSVINQLNAISADVIVLTETSKAVDLGESYHTITSTPFTRWPDENWVAIWSKWEILSQINTFDANRTACALINAPFGQLIIYGTIIPYHMAGVNGSRYEYKGYKAWQYHEEDIIKQSDDWAAIQESHPDATFLVAGDFNQTQDDLPGGYGTSKVRSLMNSKLDEQGLMCLTGIDFSKTSQLSVDPKKGRVRRNVDHIVAPRQWITRLSKYSLGAWDHFTPEGKYMSDHNGVYLDFMI